MQKASHRSVAGNTRQAENNAYREYAHESSKYNQSNVYEDAKEDISIKEETKGKYILNLKLEHYSLFVKFTVIFG